MPPRRRSARLAGQKRTSASSSSAAPRRRSAHRAGQKRTSTSSSSSSEASPKRACPELRLGDRHTLFTIPDLTQLIVAYGDQRDQLIWAYACPRELPHSIVVEGSIGSDEHGAHDKLVNVVASLCEPGHWEIAAHAIRTWAIKCVSFVRFKKALVDGAWDLVRAFIEVDDPHIEHLACAIRVHITPDWVFDYFRQHNFRFDLDVITPYYTDDDEEWPEGWMARLLRFHLIKDYEP